MKWSFWNELRTLTKRPHLSGCGHHPCEYSSGTWETLRQQCQVVQEGINAAFPGFLSVLGPVATDTRDEKGIWAQINLWDDMYQASLSFTGFGAAPSHEKQARLEQRLLLFYPMLTHDAVIPFGRMARVRYRSPSYMTATHAADLVMAYLDMDQGGNYLTYPKGADRHSKRVERLQIQGDGCYFVDNTTTFSPDYAGRWCASSDKHRRLEATRPEQRLPHQRLDSLRTLATRAVLQHWSTLGPEKHAWFNSMLARRSSREAPKKRKRTRKEMEEG